VVTHPRRNIPLLVLSVGVFGWVLALKIDLLLHPDDLLSPLSLSTTAIGSIALPLGWLVYAEHLSVREKRARQRELFPPMEIIPINRIKRPPGYDPRHARQVVVVSKRQIRRVPPLSPNIARRKALGMGTQGPQEVNKSRRHGWYRRLTW
jgi:hypothetical protein